MNSTLLNSKINGQLGIALDNAAIGMGLADLKGVWIYVNPPLCHMLGYTQQELIGKPFRDLTHKDDLNSNLSALTDLFARKTQRYSAEKRYLHKLGHYVWAQLSVSLLEFGDSAGTYCFAQIQDISQRKVDEVALRESHDLLDTLLEVMPQVAWMTDGEGNAHYFNSQWSTYTGENRADNNWENLVCFFHAEEQHNIVNIWKNAKKTGEEYSFEARLRKYDGSYEWWLVRGIPLRDSHGMVTKWVGTCTHIDDLKKTMDLAKAREEMISAQANLINQMRDAVISMDLNGEILIWNLGAERLYGWTSAEAVGKRDVDLYTEGSEERDACLKEVHERGFWEGEFAQKNKLGASLHVENRMTLMRDKSGKAKTITVIGVDVTEWKKQQAHMLRSQRLESLGTLAGGIAHDLNNVLTPILMATKYLSMNESDPQRVEMFDTIACCTRRGAEMIAQVLSFSRGVDGERREIQVSNILGDIEKIIENTFLKNIKVLCMKGADLWTIKGDSTQIHQVLLNLCVNARDAMPGGGVLTLFAENIIIDESYATDVGGAPGMYVRISVEDVGVGMSPETLARIFEPYFTTKEFGKGTGLGLPTSLAIVKSHGGFIRVVSEAGVGTKFHIYLQAMMKEPSFDLENSFCDRRGVGKCVLVVDDDLKARFAIGQTLESSGYSVLMAGGGVEALEVFHDNMESIHLV